MSTTVETGTVSSLGNTTGAILLDTPVPDPRQNGRYNTHARVHVNDLDAPVKVDDRVAFELYVDSTGDRNARHVRPL